MIIYVGGVNGVGKSTILKALATRSPKLRYIKGSSMLMESLGFDQVDYDKLRELSDEIKNNKFGEAIIDWSLKTKDSDVVILLDAHYLNVTDGKVHKVTDYWIEFVDGIILVEASLNAVINRIKKDKRDRDRRLFDSNESEKIQIKSYVSKIEREFNYIHRKYGIKNLIVNNPDGDLETPILEIKNFIENLSN